MKSSLKAVSLAILLLIQPEIADAEENPCSGTLDGLGRCPDSSEQDLPTPKPISPVTVSITGFESARIIVPDVAFYGFVRKVNSLKIELDGSRDASGKYIFDVINVRGLYDGRPLTAKGKQTVISDVVSLGLQDKVPDLNANGVLDKNDITDDLLGKLRVFSFNERLLAEEFDVQIRIQDIGSEVRTFEGPPADTPKLRGVDGQLEPSIVPD